MDRASNSFVNNNYKILLFVIVVISLLLKFVPYFVTVTILLILFGVLVYFDSSCATDICAQIASWIFILYNQISSNFVNVTTHSRKVTHPNGSMSVRLPMKMNHMNYIKMKNDVPSPIPRELNLNPSVSVRSLRNRSGGPSNVVPDYCINFRDDKLARPSLGSPRHSKVSKSSILTDITSNYAAHQSAHQRYPAQYRNDSRRDYHASGSGNVPISTNCSQLYDNISSPGFSGRIAQCVSEQNSLNYSKYENVGDSPLVHFNQQDFKKKLTPNNSHIAAKQRVTVRIAPPANRSLKKGSTVEQEEKTKSVLEVLKEMSRKRTYSSVDAEEAENYKRLRTNSLSEMPVNRRLPISPSSMSHMDITPLGKRIRDSSLDSAEEEVKKKRRQASSSSNEIQSSLSSSLTITPPHLSRANSIKRKATNDITSADKHFKTCSISDQSSETSEEQSPSSQEACPENENGGEDSSSASSASKSSNEITEVESTQEVSLDKTSGSSLTAQKTSKISEDSLDSNTSLSHDETGVLRLKPNKKPVSVLSPSGDKPKKDILRLPKDWESNPRSLQKTPKNPGKMLKKILCAIEGTDDLNFDSLPEHVKKLIASSVDEIDSPNSSAKTNTPPEIRTKEPGTNGQSKPLFSSSNLDANKASTSTPMMFSSPASSSSFKLSDSVTKPASGGFSFSATSKPPSNPLLAPQR